MEINEQIRRWRLVLGQESEERFSGMADTSLSPEQDLMDQALAAIYNYKHTWQGSGSSQSGGHGPSDPQISHWLGDVRSLFDKELVKVIQNDAINRCGLKQLVLEPEL